MEVGISSTGDGDIGGLVGEDVAVFKDTFAVVVDYYSMLLCFVYAAEIEIGCTPVVIATLSMPLANISQSW
ncbi:hypothetical protein KDW_46410 [Dictyobacter vulcani]|uniref:Uncharacterized protein n=1 Tax=Dictyobacter vulcani TaxID=2607529 RepID=A0A5J4KWH3_9CHLR|nr:hypothetical protein [Dictyobacter vulcani]GER90479.1 hypothetical protein KDW_46410 [Dictyobacter vulcani]